MKRFLAILIICINFGYAQTLPNTFKLGNFGEILSGDSIKLYFECTGTVVEKRCADYYRVGKIDTAIANVTGVFHDNYINGKLFFKANMINGDLNGNCEYYYPNGKIKETGNYLNSVRKGLWKYYFENGKLSKVLNFIGNDVLIGVQFSRKGKQMVEDGNGYYKGEFQGEYECGSYSVSGNVKDGKPEGKWMISNNAVINGNVTIENYKSGRYAELNNIDKSYIGKPLLKISGFYSNENLFPYRSWPLCPSDRLTMALLDSQILVKSFYPDLIRKIKENKILINQWVIIGIDFKGNFIKSVNVFSSRKDTALEKSIYNYINNIVGWDPVRSDDSNPQPLFFSIIINKNFGKESVLIPDEYIYRINSRYNYRIRLPYAN